MRELRFAADRINAQGGILGQKIEVLGWDNKLSPLETQTLLNRAIDEGLHYVVQGNGFQRGRHDHRRRQQEQRAQPRQAMSCILNYLPSTRLHQLEVQLLALPVRRDVDHEAPHADLLHGDEKDQVKKVYIIEQDYQFGQQVSKTAQGAHQADDPERAAGRRRAARARKGEGLRAVHREDPGVRRRHRGDRRTGAPTWRC